MKMKSFLVGLCVVLLAAPSYSAREFDNIDDHLTHSAELISGPPFSMVCWYNVDDMATDGNAFMSQASSSSGTLRYALTLARDDGTANFGDRVSAVAQADAGTWTAATATLDSTINTWEMASGVWVSTSSRFAYLNDGSSNENIGTEAVGTGDRVWIGRLADSSPNWEFDGELATCGIWDVALSAANITSLYNSGTGVAFNTVAGGDLIHCWDIAGDADPEPDSIGSAGMTVQSAPTKTTTQPAGVSCTSAAGGTAVLRRRHTQ